MKAVLVCCLLYIVPTVLGQQCPIYTLPIQQMMPPDGRTSFRCNDTDTPLGFQCEQMTYPELTTDINDYPCFTVVGVAGRHIEVLVEPVNPVAQIRTCIREDVFTERCSNGLNNYCDRVQVAGNSTIIRVFCLTGGCETSATSLWVRIVLSPGERDEENWCLTRDQAAPSSLGNVQQPVDQTFNFNQDGMEPDNQTNVLPPVNQTNVLPPVNQTFDQDGMEPDGSSFMILEPFSVATLLLIVGVLKLVFN